MKLFSIMWASYLPLLKNAAERTGLFELKAYSTKRLNLDRGLLDKARREAAASDLILLYRTNDSFWELLDDDLKLLGKRIPTIAIGSDPVLGEISNVNPEIVGTAYRYILYSGAENIGEMLKYLSSHLFSSQISYSPPQPTAWEGVYHPNRGGPFASTDEYLKVYPFGDRPLVGVLFSRSNWATGNLDLERGVIEALEGRGLGVLPVFFYSIKDRNLGNLGGEEVVRRFLLNPDETPRVEALVKLTVFFLGSKSGDMKESQAESGAKLMKMLNAPLIGPVVSYYKEKERWLEDPRGLGTQVAWSIALPEFEGVVEPVIVGAVKGVDAPEQEAYEPIADRVDRLAARVSRWINLRRKPNRDKKIAFILHNNPCASVEATIGAGAHLDTLESVALLLNRMKEEGYSVDPPADGKSLIDDILSRKAISEFRWTTTDEIVSRNGALARVEKDLYLRWFGELSDATRNRMIEAWGNPPGEERDGIPAAMVHDGGILVTGVSYGNAVVCVQPKRGCAGARCDGQVCRILHDPDVPPPHQYVATYKWLSREFGCDAVIHVGTHGNLEFLPGKGVGLSGNCFPDICVDEMPHLYIYNADNPPEGTTAKRRSLATLVDHMQAVMVRGELYGDLDEIERLLFEYSRVKDSEPAKAHTIGHMIEQRLDEGNLRSLIKVPEDTPFDELVRAAHEALSLLKNTYIPKGMHIFGKLPEGERFHEFIHALVRYENAPDSLRGVIRRLLERDPDFAGADETLKKDIVDQNARTVVVNYLRDGVPVLDGLGALSDAGRPDGKTAFDIQEKIDEVVQRTLASDEIGSLLNAMNGGYVPPGPSGIVTRGRTDILPTGRNFYSLDPQRVPSAVGWRVGVQLAEKTLGKYLDEEGTYPENIAFYWQCTDIMWSDGEGMAQMLYLLGVRPVWRSNGRVKGLEVIPSSELGRPRIDITIRVSGITRDNFPACVDLLDDAVRMAAGLDEPPEMNFVRKHLLSDLGGEDPSRADPEAFRKATYRIFSSMPGVYQAGTQLAVYASAWKDRKDLSDVFLYWNGYAYGKGVFGEPAHQTFVKALKTVDLTFSKTVTDEYDLLGCCCHFGGHGGLINAVKTVSGKEVKTYYGDTREQGEVNVRSLGEEIERVVRTKLLNPKWIEGMKEHGYKGASEIGKRAGRVYGWQATSGEVNEGLFDEIARTFLMDEENRRFFEENNPYALEETARRLIEAAERGLWKPAPDVQEALRRIYVEIEGWIEERIEGAEGEFQGGAVDVITSGDVERWKTKMDQTLGRKA